MSGTNDYLQIFVHLSQGITDMFRSADHGMSGQITVDYETFLAMLLNSPLL